MDNQNNSNLPNAPIPDPNGASVPPIPADPWAASPAVTTPTSESPITNPVAFPPVNAWPTTPLPSMEPTPTPPAQPEPQAQPETPAFPWTPPVAPEPIPSLPQEPIQPLVQPNPDPAPAWTPPTAFMSDTPVAPEPSNPWSPTPQQVTDTIPNNGYLAPQPEPQAEPTPTAIPDPVPTFTPPQMPTPEPAAVAAAPSPLDNPWGAPAQPPVIDSSQNTTQPSWSVNQPPTPTESAPTDLSHLINNNPQQDSVQSGPETLAAPSAITSNPEVPTLPAEHRKGIPTWLIGVGIGLLILVLGASAYFILGVGQPTKTASLPVTTTPPANDTVKPPVPAAVPTAQPAEQQVASDSAANFGQLGGSNGNQQEGTSAAELLRQRQQGR